MKKLFSIILMIVLGATTMFAQDMFIIPGKVQISGSDSKFEAANLIIVDDNGEITVGIMGNGMEKFALGFNKGGYTLKKDKLPYTVRSNDGKYELAYFFDNGFHAFVLATDGQKKKFVIPSDNFRVSTEAEGGFKINMDGIIFIKNHFPLIFGGGSSK